MLSFGAKTKKIYSKKSKNKHRLVKIKNITSNTVVCTTIYYIFAK
jgi:hypothetical protein